MKHWSTASSLKPMMPITSFRYLIFVIQKVVTGFQEQDMYIFVRPGVREFLEIMS
jgi:hypothetical protein